MARAAAVIAMLPLVALPALAIPEPSGIPPRLRAAPADEPAFSLSGAGDHVFECKPSGGGYAWTFVAPDARLYDGSREAATSTVPNLWESNSDRSSVTASVRTTLPAGEDLPWALYGAQGIGDSGLFAGVTAMQRVATAGGAAPADGCDAGSVGSEARVPFTAQYHFYRRAGG